MIDYSKYNYSDEEGYTLKKQNQKTKKEAQKVIIDDILKSLKLKNKQG